MVQPCPWAQGAAAHAGTAEMLLCSTMLDKNTPVKIHVRGTDM